MKVGEIRELSVDELHGREQELDSILATLRTAGFRVHLHPELVSRRPFIEHWHRFVRRRCSQPPEEVYKQQAVSRWLGNLQRHGIEPRQ